MARTSVGTYRRRTDPSNSELSRYERGSGSSVLTSYGQKDLSYSESNIITTTVYSLSKSLSRSISGRTSAQSLQLKFKNLVAEEDESEQSSIDNRVSYHNAADVEEWRRNESIGSDAVFNNSEDSSFFEFSSNSYLLWWRKFLYFILSKPTHYDVEILSKINRFGKKKFVFLMLLPFLLYFLFCGLRHINVEEFESGSDFPILPSLQMDKHDNLSNSWIFFPDILSMFSVSGSIHHVTAENTFDSNSDQMIIENPFNSNSERLSIEDTFASKSSVFSNLNSSEVEAIIRRLLLEEFHLSPALQKKSEQSNSMLTEKINTILRDFMVLKSDFKSLKENVNVLNDKSTKDSKTLESVKASQNDDKKLYENMQNMEEKLFILESSLNHMKNCCRNETSLFPVVKNYVNSLFENLMSDSESNFEPFRSWLFNNFVINEKFEKSLNAIRNEGQVDEVTLKETLKQHIETLFEDNVRISSTGQGTLEKENITEIEQMIKKAILLYDADKTGQTDYALESGGGSIVGTRCSETYTENSARISILGFPLWHISNSPRNAIQPSVHPGECWAFKGSQGYLVIQLATVIKPTGFVIEHIPKSISSSGNIDSAPREFSVYGLISEKDYEGELLGKYIYDRDGDPLQYFPVQAKNIIPYRYVELKIHSNQGSVNYTCLYRFRIHGLRA